MVKRELGGGDVSTIVAERGGWYPWYVAAVLALASALAQLDRQVMGLLTEPVKADLGLTDVEVSLLQGLAFVLMHSLMAFPIGYLTDRMPRRTLLAIGILLWSLATAACGLARSFAGLFLARFAVGVGEASLWPGAQSLLPDYFAPAKLSRAFTVFQAGAYLGNGSAYAVGGLILVAASGWIGSAGSVFADMEPWQITFVLVAAPGPLVALLMLTVREPARAVSCGLGTAPDETSTFARFLVGTRGFLAAHLATVALSGVVVFAIVAWTPSLFVRSFGWTPAQIGIAYGSIAMIAGALGTLASTPLAHLLTRDGSLAGPARASLAAMVVGMPAAVLFPLSPSPSWALGALAVFSFAIGISSTLMPVVLQLATPAAFRGRMGAIYLFASNALGAALGPIVVALLTDVVLRDPQRLWLSLAIMAGVTGPFAIFACCLCRNAFHTLTAANTVATKPTNTMVSHIT